MSRRCWGRLGLTLGAGAGTAVVAAVVLAIVDMYLAGHALPRLTGPLLDWPPFGVHLSVADLILLVAVALAMAITWRRAGERP